MPIATGHEREELEAELQGKKILDIDFPEGPFGTKEAPAVVKSYYDKRIVGCPGGEGEDEHDVVWFWLEKGKPHECPVCSQYFVRIYHELAFNADLSLFDWFVIAEMAFVTLFTDIA
nr:putative cytochrome C oxidase subunit 5B-like [Ipomoea batatas]